MVGYCSVGVVWLGWGGRGLMWRVSGGGGGVGGWGGGLEKDPAHRERSTICVCMCAGYGRERSTTQSTVSQRKAL